MLAESDDCVKIIGLDGTLQFMNEGGQRVMEIEDFGVVKGCPWPDFWQGQGNLDAVAAISAAKAGKRSRFTGFADTAKGNRRFWDVKVVPLVSDEGAVESILSISRDISDSKLFEEQQSLLRNELSHRIKNILALVHAVANQTLKDDDEISKAKPALLARIASLGRAHDILMQSSNSATTLEAVVLSALQEDFAERIKLNGPSVTLSAKSGLAIALALHELMTNAVKYGALSNAIGQVDVTWTASKTEDGEQISLRWSEHGGPAVAEPTRKGFGSRMIERALASYVKGKTVVQYRSEGLSFELTAKKEDLEED